MAKVVARREPNTMPERVEQYRVNAEKCLEVAKTFKDPEAKRTMLVTAHEWLMLAAGRVKNIATANKLVPPLNPSPPDDPS